MSWVPTTDFEEEVVNLQPDHDFIYGTLSEPQYAYPRPQSHVEYAVNRKLEKKLKVLDNNGTSNKMNTKLQVIAQVQRMANTKPLGEQPSLDDWDNTSKIEQETIGMMRYHGLLPSVEQPLNEKITIATFPVENKIKVVRNGHRKMAHYFDENVFKLKRRVSDDSSSGIENASENNSFASNVGDNARLTANKSFTTSTSASSSSHLLSICDNNDLTTSFNSAQGHQQSLKLTSQHLSQYDKLLKDTTSLSLNCNNNSNTTVATDSFKTGQEDLTSWRPVACDDDYIIEDILNDCENWPDLKNKSSNACNLSTCSTHSKNDHLSDANNISSKASSSSSSNSHKRASFLDRFIQPQEDLDNSIPKSANTSSIPSNNKPLSCAPKTYASVAKESEKSQKSSLKIANEETNSLDFVPFYSPRKMYALKRNT